MDQNNAKTTKNVVVRDEFALTNFAKLGILKTKNTQAPITIKESFGTLVALNDPTGSITSGILKVNTNKSPEPNFESFCIPIPPQRNRILVGPVGIEPTTHGLKVRCSTD